jgi:hypothetical protein
VLQRFAFAITAAAVLLSFLSIPAVVVAGLLLQTSGENVLNALDDGTPLTTVHLTRNADGSSTGVYFQRNLKILIRRRGYGPGSDGESTFNPMIWIPFLTIPPILWFFTHRPSRAASLRSGGAHFIYLCAACPFAVNVAVLYLRRNDGSPLFFAAWGVVAAMIYGLTQLDRLPSRTGRRIRQGLCPNCGYDLRATPHRCPECGLRV